MATPTPPPDDDGFSDSDRVWFDRLRGKPVAADDPAVLREADALRRALRLRNEAEQADPRLEEGSTPQARQQRAERLQFRLRREGLLEPAAKRRPRWLPAVGLAAAVMLAAVLVPRMLVDDTVYYDAPPAARGDLPVTQRRADQPREAAEALKRTLDAAGLRPAIWQRGRTFVVDAEVDPAALDTATPVLRAAGLPVRAGWQRVEFSAP